MTNQFSRIEILMGEAAVRKLQASKVAVFGLGGVGSYCVEALARSGVGKIALVDNDKIAISNLNRQIYALHSTIGKFKTDAAKERILDINPNTEVETYKLFYTAHCANEFDFSRFDYVVDAIDTVSGKLTIIEECHKLNIPVISSMGTGNKMCPSLLETADIYNTSVCPLARVIRQELKKRKIPHLKVVYSKEKPIKSSYSEENSQKRTIPGSNAFVPSSAGLLIASEVIKDLVGYESS